MIENKAGWTDGRTAHNALALTVKHSRTGECASARLANAQVRALASAGLRECTCMCAHSHTHALASVRTRALTHSRTHISVSWCTCALAHSRVRALTHSRTRECLIVKISIDKCVVRRTDGPTDTTSYRDATAHLKRMMMINAKKTKGTLFNQVRLHCLCFICAYRLLFSSFHH